MSTQGDSRPGTVEFINVGRSKKSWSADIHFDEGSIAREASKALASAGVDAEYDSNSTIEGSVLVGGFRAVGRFKVHAPRKAGS